MPEEWLTLDEIAEELRVSVETVRRWIRTKQLKALSIGRGYRIKRKDYEDFLRRRTIDIDEEENS
ncbi:MAG TPA: helix-turn-helix domain-containing protein [Ktedonobacteraceae bacterium]|nr:helix-turn-helix domain-containing protein [Ktedonobacteraceae bacterium]